MKFLYNNLLLFLLMPWTGQHKAVAQNPISNLSFEQITKKQGLAGSAVTDIFQDSRGFIWVGTSNGVSRYDGLHHKNYSTSEQGGITDKIITSIAEDANGNIWLATENGLNKLNPITDKIEQYFEGTGPGTIPYKWCNKVYLDKQKNLWLGTEKGLALFNPKTNSFENTPVSLYGKDARVNKFIKDVFEDSKDRFWLATSYGIKLFDRKTKTYKSYHLEEPAGERLPENIFVSFAEDSHGSILALSPYFGLYRYNAGLDKFERTNVTLKGLKAFELTNLIILTWQGREYLVITALTGIFCIDNSQVSNNPNDTEPLFTHFLNDVFARRLFYDASGNLWTGCEQGLYRCSANSFAFQWIPVKSPLTGDDRIYHIIPDLHEKENLFYLTTPNGWYRYNMSTGYIAPHQLPAGGQEMLHYINNWVTDEKGYWFTSMYGCGYYNIYSNQVLDLTGLVVASSGQKATGYIAKDNSNRIWLTIKRNGILVYDPVTRKTETLFADKNKPGNTYGEGIGDLQKGRDGNIYFTALDRLYVVSPADFSFKTFPVPPPGKGVNPLKARPGKIVFTGDGRTLVTSGLFIYELKKGQLHIISPAKGYLPYEIQTLIPLQNGSTWIKADEGCFKTDTSFSKWVSYDEILSNQEEDAVFVIQPVQDEEVLFGGNGRLGLLKESLLRKKSPPAPVLISRIKTGAKEYFLEAADNHSASFKEAVEVELAPLNYLADKETKVIYRLEGWDNEWKELGSTPVIRYEQLPPGHYTFITKAISAAGQEGAATNLRFRIRPPFYLTWWFILLSLAGICTAAVLLYRYRIKKAIQMERLRTRIATDLHDDIGATLSSISMYSEAIKNQLKGSNPRLEAVLNKMGENSRDMVTSMSDIVWAINPDNDDGEKLLKRMESYAADMCAVKNIQLHIAADEKIKAISFPLEHRKNIYLIFKESVNNAVKYSGAGNMYITLRLKGHELMLEIKDDGSGFDSTTVKKGNGLRNLLQRAAEIGGTLRVDTAPGKGTSILLTCTV